MMDLKRQFTSASNNSYPYYPADGELDVMVYNLTPFTVGAGHPWDWEDFNPAVFNGATDYAGSVQNCHRIRLQRASVTDKWRITAEIIPITRVW